MSLMASVVTTSKMKRFFNALPEMYKFFLLHPCILLKITNYYYYYYDNYNYYYYG